MNEQKFKVVTDIPLQNPKEIRPKLQHNEQDPYLHTE